MLHAPWGKISNYLSVDALAIAIAEEPDSGVRWQILDALGELGAFTRKGIDSLIAALNGSDEKVCEKAISVLRQMGGIHAANVLFIRGL